MKDDRSVGQTRWEGLRRGERKLSTHLISKRTEREVRSLGNEEDLSFRGSLELSWNRGAKAGEEGVSSTRR